MTTPDAFPSVALHQLLRSLGLLLVLAGSSLRAMTVVPPTLAELVTNSQAIVRVEVSALKSRWDADNGQRAIHTYVTCQVGKTLKGTVDRSVTLRFLGGRVDDAQMIIEDMPSLELGSHYYLFLRRDGAGNAFCPLVAVMHGAYKVREDPELGRETIERMDGTALASIADVSRTHGIQVPALTASQRMTSGDFEEAVVRELAHATGR